MGKTNIYEIENRYYYMKHLKGFLNYIIESVDYPKDLEDSPTGNLWGLKLNGNKFDISDVDDSKQYVYKYNHNGKDLFYYNDNTFDGGTSKARILAVLGSDINNARRFTGKRIKIQFLERRHRSIWIGPEMYYKEEGCHIKLDQNPDIIEV